MNPGLSSFIDLSRWFAAFLVVIYHARQMLFVGYQDSMERGVVAKGFYFITAFGHEAVVIFFVISGFLVGGLTLVRWTSATPSFRDYAISRVARIYTVLVPALIVGALLDVVGLKWFDASGLYTDPSTYPTRTLNGTISAALDVRTFTCNLALLNGAWCQNLGSNGPLWSLAYEWWYYVLFALVAGGIATRRPWMVVLAAVVAIILPGKLVLWSCIWLLGVVAQVWIRRGRYLPHPAFGVTVFIATAIISRLSHTTEDDPMLIAFARDMLLGFGFVVAIAGCATLTRPLRLSWLHASLAEFSYTTYLFHFPALLLLAAFGFQQMGIRLGAQLSAYSIMHFVAVLVILYAYAFAVFRLVERHTGVVKSLLHRMFAQREQSQAVSEMSREGGGR